MNEIRNGYQPTGDGKPVFLNPPSGGSSQQSEEKPNIGVEPYYIAARMADFEHVFASLWWDSAKLHLCGLHKEAKDMKEAMWWLKSQHAEIKNLKARLAERDCKVPNLATCPGWREGER